MCITQDRQWPYNCLYFVPAANNFTHRLEERRKVKSKAYYERKKAARRNLAKAEQGANVDSKTKSQLAQYGY